MRAREGEPARGLGDVPVAVLEGAADQLGLEAAQGLAVVEGGGALLPVLSVRKEVSHVDLARVFAGGANNFLQVATEEESRRAIFAAGGWAWPDAATSGGGWTLAVIDVLTRSQGRQASANGDSGDQQSEAAKKTAARDET